MMAKNEVAVRAENFNLVTLDGDLAEAIAEEMDGLGTIPFERVKIPSGGSITFELPGENDEETESATELVGVILDHNPVNAYWVEKFAGGNERPDCSSYDGKQGVDRRTGEVKSCESCPYNQFGSDGDGKACKNIHRLFILRENNPVPLILSLPPTSIKSMRDYVAKRILLKGYRCWKVLTKITLKKEKNRNNIAYSRAVFTFLDALTPEQIQKTEQMRNVVKSVYRTIDIEEGEYDQPERAQAPKVNEDGFMNIPDDLDDDALLFN